MEDYPKNLLEFEHYFSTEEACRQYFLKLRWPKGFRCPNCGNQKAWLSGQSLENAIQNHIEPGSIIQTDGWQGYNGICEQGYIHEVIRKDSEVGNKLLPKAHLVASLLKRWLMGTYQGAVRPVHLDYYLDEYTFRFNRRTSRSRGKLFYRLLQNAAEIRPVTIREIQGQKSGAATIDD